MFELFQERLLPSNTYYSGCHLFLHILLSSSNLFYLYPIETGTMDVVRVLSEFSLTILGHLSVGLDNCKCMSLTWKTSLPLLITSQPRPSVPLSSQPPQRPSRETGQANLTCSPGLHSDEAREWHIGDPFPELVRALA